MERITEINEIKHLFGKNFIGIDEIKNISGILNIASPNVVPGITYSMEELKIRSKDSILILGLDRMIDGSKISIFSLRKQFGIDPSIEEPCFYNQDWYLNEKFIHTPLELKWYLFKKDVIEESRAVPPDLLKKTYKFPHAVLCAYSFFVYWFHNDVILWPNDYIWCSDVDHNGDQIYIGKYLDIEGINKNGFSIHRHLKLRKSYASISVF